MTNDEIQSIISDKSPQYIEFLLKIVQRYQYKDQHQITSFIKYADPNSGGIESKEGLFFYLTKDIQDVGVFVVDSQIYIVLNLYEHKLEKAEEREEERREEREESDQIVLKKEYKYNKIAKVEKSKITKELKNVSEFLWIIRHPWASMIHKVRSFWPHYNMLIMSEDLSSGYYMKHVDYF